MAIEDLVGTFGPRYPNGRQYLSRLDALSKDLKRLEEKAQDGQVPLDAERKPVEEALAALAREALLANPLLDFDRLLLVQRGEKGPALGLPYMRLHDMRHTAATLLLEQGESLKVVAERLGHSSIRVTARRLFIPRICQRA